MGKNRSLPTHALIHHQLTECIVQMIIAADHMGYAHIMIVNNDSQHIGRAAIAAQNHHVIQNLVLNCHRALNSIINCCAAI